MIEFLPLSLKKLEILKHIYEHQPIHLRKIASDLGIHPYQAKKIIDATVDNKLLEKQSAGRTILLRINPLADNAEQLFYIIESYKQETKDRTLATIIKNLKHLERNILASCIFGSFARGAATKTSDVDVLLVVKHKPHPELNKKLSQINALLRLRINPIIMDENEFETALKLKEPTMATVLEPAQRILVSGIEYFLTKTHD